MAVSLTKRPFIESTDNVVGGAQLSLNKRPIHQENFTFKRPSVFPRLEFSMDEIIQMTGKTTFTVDEVKDMMNMAVRINERKIREEYDKVLNEKLKEQFQSFAIYQRDYLAKQYGESDLSYYL